MITEDAKLRAIRTICDVIQAINMHMCQRTY